MTKSEKQAVLKALKDPHGMNAIDHVIRSCELPPATTVRILHALVDEGIVEVYDRGRYREVT